MNHALNFKFIKPNKTLLKKSITMADIKDSKILVIGGAGFIGSHVVGELLKEDVGEVIIYDNFCRGTKKNIENALTDPRCRVFDKGGDVMHTDLLNEAMKGVDYVFHLAALWLLHCSDFPRSAFKVNIEGTFNVLEACVKNKVKKLIYSSSASVYGDAIEVPMTEAHPFNNRNFYGATKIAGEAMCTAFHDKYGLDFVGLRYMNVYGPRQDNKGVYTCVIPIMLNKIAANESPMINGDGSQAYDFIFVEDVARANVYALKSDATGKFYNTATGVKTSIKELCETILHLKNSNLEINYKPYDKEDARALVKNRIGSIEKAKVETGFEYKYTLEEGLKELIAFEENGL